MFFNLWKSVIRDNFFLNNQNIVRIPNPIKNNNQAQPAEGKKLESLADNGLNTFFIKNSPKKLIFEKNIIMIKITRVIRSIIRSIITVPTSESKGILSVLFNTTHLVISPSRGAARFAKYPIITA